MMRASPVLIRTHHERSENTFMPAPLQIYPVKAPVQEQPFELMPTLLDAIYASELQLQEGDMLAISSKYVAISEGRIVSLDDVQPDAKAYALAEQYHMDARIAQLVVDEAEHIFGGIPMGYLLTWRQGVMSPNAGLDRSNIPSGQVVLLPADNYASAHAIRNAILEQLGVRVGVILTDSWLVPGRLGTTGIALSAAGFKPVEDERGKADLFGNPMTVTQRGVADSLSVCAQMVMGERDEATPVALLRNTGVPMSDAVVQPEELSIPWGMCLYVESLTLGLLPDGAPTESLTASLAQKSRDQQTGA
jgi:coenzyme F420-0:L-glutamate ligase/coenzyme F420-1:gamma-L-glutamate ligase